MAPLRNEATSLASAGTVIVAGCGVEQLSPARIAGILEQLDLTARIAAAGIIFVKVNLAGAGRYAASSGANVSSVAAENVIEALLSIAPTAEVLVAESDSVGANATAPEKFRASGYEAAFGDRRSVTLFDVSRAHPLVRVADGPLGDLLYVPQAFVRADFVVSLGKVKTHNLTAITGVLKNQFGMLATKNKAYLHPFLSQAIKAVNLCRPVELGILDGSPAMEGDGPLRGERKDLGLSLFGRNAVAVDAVVCGLAGLHWRHVPHVRQMWSAGQTLWVQSLIGEDGMAARPEAGVLRRPGATQRGIVRVAMAVQRLGTVVQEIGHQAHGARRLGDLRKAPRAIGHTLRSLYK